MVVARAWFLCMHVTTVVKTVPPDYVNRNKEIAGATRKYTTGTQMWHPTEYTATWMCRGGNRARGVPCRRVAGDEGILVAP